MRRLAVAAVLSALIATGLVACGSSTETACAAPITKSGGGAGSASSGRSPSAGKPAAPPKPASPSGGGAKPAAPAKPAGPNASKPAAPAAPRTPPPKSSTQSAASSASKPTSKPAAGDVSKAKAEAPPRVTRGGSYYSSVSGNTYVYNDVGYYRRPGYVVDIWDPYDPFNYWYFPTSPFYGRPYETAGDCSGGDDHVEQKQEVNITVDQDGKVAKVEDPPAGQPGAVTYSGATP